MSDAESHTSQGPVTQDDPKDPDYFPEDLGFNSDAMSSSNEAEEVGEEEQQPARAPGNVAPSLRCIDLTDAQTDVSTIIDNAQNPSTRRNIDSVIRTYDSVMESLREKTGENVYMSLKETSVSQLPHNLCRYIAVAVKQDGGEYNASTLEQHVARLQAWILRAHKVDINSDPRFSDIKPILKKRCKDSVAAGQRPGKHAARAVSEDLTKQAVAEGKFGRQSPRILIRTVVYIMQTGLGTRAIKVLSTN